MSPGGDELVATLDEVEALRRQTRAALHPAWFPLVVFGVLGLAAAPFGLIRDGLGLGPFWLVAGPAGSLATSYYYRRRSLSAGVALRRSAYRPHVVLAVVLFVSAWTAGALSRSAAPPMVAVAAGYVGFAYLERSWPCAAVAVALAAAAGAVGLRSPAHGDVILTIAFGLSFAVTGLLVRRADGR